jgi:hypothetical protein
VAREAANGGVVGHTLLASLGSGLTEADQLRVTNALGVALGSGRRLNEPTRL